MGESSACRKFLVQYLAPPVLKEYNKKQTVGELKDWNSVWAEDTDIDGSIVWFSIGQLHTCIWEKVRSIKSPEDYHIADLTELKLVTIGKTDLRLWSHPLYLIATVLCSPLSPSSSHAFFWIASAAVLLSQLCDQFTDVEALAAGAGTVCNHLAVILQAFPCKISLKALLAFCQSIMDFLPNHIPHFTLVAWGLASLIFANII